MSLWCLVFLKWRNRLFERNSGAYILILVALASFPRLTHAYEDEIGLGAGGQFSVDFGSDVASTPGGSVEFLLDVGLYEFISLRSNLAFGYSDTHESLRLLAGVELIYLMDFLTLVPFVGFGFTNEISDPGELAYRGGPHFVGGLDLHLSRRWVAGLDIRYAWMTLRSFQPEIERDFLFMGTLRATYYWEL